MLKDVRIGIAPTDVLFSSNIMSFQCSSLEGGLGVSSLVNVGGGSFEEIVGSRTYPVVIC